MKAKYYLRQLRKLDLMINNKMIEKEQWKAIATVTTARADCDRVQSSGSKQKMADAIGRYIDIENEIDRCIDNLVDAKKDVISVIEQLEQSEYDILHKVYIQYMSLSDVAAMEDKSYSLITTIHGNALKHVQIILNEREKHE